MLISLQDFVKWPSSTSWMNVYAIFGIAAKEVVSGKRTQWYCIFDVDPLMVMLCLT